MRNPDKYLRAAYITALAGQGLTAYDKKVPIDQQPPPSTYILVASQTKTTTVRSKTDFEWNSRITLNIISVNPVGVSKTSVVDDMEEKCITVIENGILVSGFYVKSTYQISSLNLDIDGKTNSIERRVLLYEHWVAEIETT